MKIPEYHLFAFWERNEVIMCNPIKTLTKKEWALWLGSLAAVIISNIITGNIELLTLAATCIGVTALTLLRSSYYALGYASNDIVLIVLWILASFKNPVYLPVAFNFMIFFVNDLYGFISWKKREAMISPDMDN